MSPQSSYNITPEIKLQALVYVDDIAGAGTKEVIEGIGNNLQQLEKKKGFTFGTDKTNYLIIKTGKEKDELVELKVKKGMIEKADNYKYLGLIIHENGTIEKHIEAMMKKGIGMMKDVAKLGHQNNVGEMSTLIQLFLYEKVVVPSLTYNLEGITYWRKADIIQLEKVQAKLLKMLLELPDSTPYWGLLNELGIWPLEDFINYKKFMLLQNLMNADENRMAKKLIKQQKQYETEGSWYSKVAKISKEYKVDLENDDLLKDKHKWKTHVKEQIKLKIISKSEEKKNSMSKLRHQKEQEFIMQEYIKETSIWRIRDLIRVKLEMLDIGRNQGENRICCGCHSEEESTEHIVSCRAARELTGIQDETNTNITSERCNLINIYNILKKYMEYRDNEIVTMNCVEQMYNDVEELV